MNASLKKKLLILSGCISVAFLAVGLIGYKVVKKFTSRVVHSAERIASNHAKSVQLFYDHNAQSITFKSSDGITLSGILITRPQAKRNWILAHGYRMSKERLVEFAKILPDDNLLLFDFRSHGHSAGDSITFGYYEKYDVFAALAFLQNNESTKELPVYAIGVSMGALSLLAAISAGAHFEGLVIDSVVNGIYNPVEKEFTKKTGLPRMPFMSAAKWWFEFLFNCSFADIDTVAWAKKANLPVLMVHSAHDSLSFLSEVECVYSVLPGKKAFWIVDNVRHGRIFTNLAQQYHDTIYNFFGFD